MSTFGKNLQIRLQQVSSFVAGASLLMAGSQASASTHLSAAASTEKTAEQQVALGRIWRWENERNARGNGLISYLNTADPEVSQRAALAMGRVGSERFVAPLTQFVLQYLEPAHSENTSVLNNRGALRNALFSLGTIGSQSLPPAQKTLIASTLLKARNFSEVSLASEAYVSLGKLGLRENFSTIAQNIVAEANEEVLEGSVEGLLQLWMKEKTDWGDQPALFERLLALTKSANDILSQKAAVALVRWRAERSQAQLQALALSIAKGEISLPVRSLLLRSIGAFGSKEAQLELTNLLSQPISWTTEELVEVANATGRLPYEPSAIKTMLKLLKSERTRVQVAALEAAVPFSQKLKSENASPATISFLKQTEIIVASILQQRKKEAQVQVAGILFFAEMHPEKAAILANAKFEIILQLAREGKNPSEANALSAIASNLQATVDQAWVQTFVKFANFTVIPDLEEAMELFPLPLRNVLLESLAQKDTEFLGQFSPFKYTLSQVLRTGDFRSVCHVAAIAQQAKDFTLADILLSEWQTQQSPERLESRSCLLDYYGFLLKSGTLSDPSREKVRQLFRTAINDPLLQIAQLAAVTLQEEFKEEVVLSADRANTTFAPTPLFSHLNRADGKIIEFVTNKGRFYMQTLPEAPITAANIIRMVKQGFYSNLTFHRVIPNFVAQGGDPHGDGWGGPKELLRDEVSPLDHAAGTVGIATSGKDTGGSQFFINEALNLHLNGNYTIFAKVTSGFNVVKQLGNGDTIQSARVLPASF